MRGTRRPPDRPARRDAGGALADGQGLSHPRLPLPPAAGRDRPARRPRPRAGGGGGQGARHRSRRRWRRSASPSASGCAARCAPTPPAGRGWRSPKCVSIWWRSRPAASRVIFAAHGARTTSCERGRAAGGADDAARRPRRRSPPPARRRTTSFPLFEAAIACALHEAPGARSGARPRPCRRGGRAAEGAAAAANRRKRRWPRPCRGDMRLTRRPDDLRRPRQHRPARRLGAARAACR